MLIHPIIHLEIARQRHQDLLAGAERRRIAEALGEMRRRDSADRHTRNTTSDRASSTANGKCEGVPTAADHFGHRDGGGIVVDLFWNRGELKDEFRVEVEDVREGVRFILHATTGREALQAFYHPFSMVGRADVGAQINGGFTPDQEHSEIGL
jgi:hypothetical protein